MKKDEYTKTLAKNQVCEIFQMRDIGKNGLPKFIKLCMETPCWCPIQEHKLSITFVLHAIFFFRQALAGNVFSKSPPPPPPQELNGRPLITH